MKNINIRHEPFTVYEANRKHRKGKLYRNKEASFGDFGKWDQQKKSLFIESIIYGFPIPLFLAKRKEEGCLEIIDGRERLLTIREFSENQLKLSDLEIIEGLNGYYYRDLGIHCIAFEDRKLDFFVLPCNTKEEIVSKLWNRLNENRLG